jgi:hypothetical protein
MAGPAQLLLRDLVAFDRLYGGTAAPPASP